MRETVKTQPFDMSMLEEIVRTDEKQKNGYVFYKFSVTDGMTK